MRRVCLAVAVGLVATVTSAGAQPGGAAGETLTVEAAVEEAVARNLDLLARRYDLTMAEAALVTAGLRPNPEVGIDAEHLDPRHALTSDAGAGPAEYAVRIDWPLERGGKRARRLDMATHERAAVEWQIRDYVRMLGLDVRSAAVDLVHARDGLALAEDSLRAFEDIVRLNRARVERGDLAGVELMRAEVAALQFRAAVRRQALELAQARARLWLLLGRSGPAGAIDVRDPVLDAVTPPPALEPLLTVAREARPDLGATRAEQARAVADAHLQAAMRTLDFTVGAEVRQVQGAGHALGVFFGVPVPLFDRNQGELARARAGEAQAARALDAHVRAVDSEVRVAHLDLTTAWDLLGAIEDEMLPKATRVREITDYAYRRGEASLLELLDAQMAYNDTVEALNASRAEYRRARYLLDAAIGVPAVP